MNIAKNIFKYIFSVFIIYLFIFNPVILPIGHFGLLKLLYPLLVLYIAKKNCRRQFFQFWDIFKLYIWAIVCCSLVAIFVNPGTIYTRIVNFIEIFMLPVCIVYLFKKYNVKLHLVIFLTASVASIISFYAYINPSFLITIRSIQPILEKANELMLETREYGLSSELYSGFGWALGFIVVYMIKYIKKYSVFFIFFPLIAFAILINARSGFVCIFIGAVVYALYEHKISIFFQLLIISSMFIYIVMNMDLSWINDSTLLFITDFFEQIKFVFTGEGDTYLDTYYNYHMIFPDNLFQLFLGRGFSLMGNDFGVKRSDVGYLNDLAVGGILYIVLVYTCFYKLFKLVGKNWFFYAILLIVAAINIKGQCLDTCGFSRIISLICIYEFTINRDNFLKNKYLNNEYNRFKTKISIS